MFKMFKKFISNISGEDLNVSYNMSNNQIQNLLKRCSDWDKRYTRYAGLGQIQDFYPISERYNTLQKLFAITPENPKDLFKLIGFNDEKAKCIKESQEAEILQLLNSNQQDILDLNRNIEKYEAIAQSPTLRDKLRDVLTADTTLVGKAVYKRDSAHPIGVIKTVSKREDIIEIKFESQTKGADDEPSIEIPTIAPKEYCVTINNTAYLLDELDISTYKPRKPFLWGWCMVNAKLTTQAILNKHLISNETESNSLAYLKLLMIFVNVMIDDIADQIQNKQLLDSLLTYLNRTLSRYPNEELPIILENEKSTLLSSIPENYSHFHDYLEFTTEMWQKTFEKAQELIPENFNNLMEDWQEDYKLISKAMEESQKTSSWWFMEQNADTTFTLECDIADNMNMRGFESVDSWYYIEHYLSKTKRNEFLTDRKIYKENYLKHLQFMAQTANHLSTAVRELDDNDVSNALFLILSEISPTHKFDLDMLLRISPLVRHSVMDRVKQSLTRQKVFGELIFHWFVALQKILAQQAASPKIPNNFGLDENITNIKKFTISYLKFMGRL